MRRLLVHFAVALHVFFASVVLVAGDLVSLELREKYRGEEIGEAEGFKDFVAQTRYFDLETRESHKLVIRNGLLLWQKDRSPFDTKNGLLTRLDGEVYEWTRAMVVMGMDGEIYASLSKIHGQLHHSSFFGAAPVAFAGTLRSENGKLVEIRDWSGHFKPKLLHLMQFVHSLKARGVDLSEVRYEAHFGGIGSYFKSGGSVTELVSVFPEWVLMKWQILAPKVAEFKGQVRQTLLANPRAFLRITRLAPDKYPPEAQELLAETIGEVSHAHPEILLTPEFARTLGYFCFDPGVERSYRDAVGARYPLQSQIETPTEDSKPKPASRLRRALSWCDSLLTK